MKYILLLSFLVSCTSTQMRDGKPRMLEAYYHTSGVERYFLAQLPDWANFSSEGQCRRTKPVRYLNFTNLHKSFKFSYEQLAQFQYMINKRMNAFVENSDAKILRPKDEEFIFYNVKDQISGGAKEFMTPKFKQVSLIWVDPAVTDGKAFVKLRKYINSDAINHAEPVLVSMCLDDKEMARFIKTRLKNAIGLKYISSEMFTPYNQYMQLSTEYSISFENLFKKDQKVQVITPVEEVPISIKGKFKVNKL